jgi:cytochrome c oxidase cbb3-type subunit I/II
LDISTTEAKINALRSVGVPYEIGYEKIANTDLQQQADIITKDLQKQGLDITSDKEIIALIAYLQRLGTDIKPK